uniref:Uncharacterized protein n=1 Tax=Octopus bimaculoides TaxID=37653 RepID=A0A0L8GGS0_OCTBM
MLTIQPNNPKILPLFLLMTMLFIPRASHLICAKILSLLYTIVDTIVRLISKDRVIATTVLPFSWRFIIASLSSSVIALSL